jgi:hypothetical protein
VRLAGLGGALLVSLCLLAAGGEILLRTLYSVEADVL